MKPYVRSENARNVKTVPIRPKSTIYPKLSKNFFLLMLKPDAKMIGGRQRKKKTLPLNSSKLLSYVCSVHTKTVTETNSPKMRAIVVS